LTLVGNYAQWIIGIILIFSSLGVILANKPVHSSLYFLLTLLMLAALFLQQSAEFIAVMQVLVYAGAILVIFMFVIVLFQDAHVQIDRNPPQSSSTFIFIAAGSLLTILLIVGKHLIEIEPSQHHLSEGFGTVEALGKALYIDFFLPFEVVILLFLVALIGAFYIGKKES
jgi:NADH-quinone oxidoreductase subunit J